MSNDVTGRTPPGASSGPGVYGPELAKLIEDTEAKAAIVLILGGNRGTGFSVGCRSEMLSPKDIVSILRKTADSIEKGAVS
jgi:hypothetical protein